MKKQISICAAVLILVSGCSMDNGYRYITNKEEQETDYSSIYAEVTEFSGFANKEYESELNMLIRDNIKNEINEFDVLAQESAKEIPAGVKSDMHISCSVKRNTKSALSFVTERYIYTGGAHGTTTWYPYTVAPLSEDPHDLELSELFVENTDYLEVINRIITDTVLSDKEKYNELWAEPKLTKEAENRFYLTDTELVIYFPPYELSYYAKGFIEFPIRLSEISGIVRPEFLPEETTGDI